MNCSCWGDREQAACILASEDDKLILENEFILLHLTIMGNYKLMMVGQ